MAPPDGVGRIEDEVVEAVNRAREEGRRAGRQETRQRGVNRQFAAALLRAQADANAALAQIVGAIPSAANALSVSATQLRDRADKLDADPTPES